MRLNDAFEMLKEAFPKAIEVSHPEKINQKGLYLYFDGVTPSEVSKDNANFVLLLAGVTLSSKSDDSIVQELQAIRKQVFMLGTKEQKNFFKGIKAAVFEGDKLFMYAIKLEIEVSI